MGEGGLPGALLLAALAGASAPVGAWLATRDGVLPGWLREEFRHTVTAFGGGALISAVALVLVPEGSAALPAAAALAAFAAGGFAFFLLDRALERRGGHVAQFMAMLLDYLPEAMALGAMLGGAPRTAALLAFLIALQNLPEGFNAWREMHRGRATNPRRLALLFGLMLPAGMGAAWLGVAVLAEAQAALGAVMLFAAGGILYIVFEDVAPQAPLDRHWSPPLGAVAGFLLGLAGYLATG
ncbi:zinc transporter, ZIP family [Rhodovulum sp. ES.010]|uniref:ZIP family metal transporter n=1 Tax=Rhodovulum sp. ES.010 TaxID=1882821 RepID=UPI000925D6B9|nr:divalent cation transporter [Rhodovulum sp. ES.010]SIO40909.1 zinc transporter, ZIP family [Rhodovulum sp. ES.010]